MELGLSLGESPSPAKPCSNGGVAIKAVGLSLEFCMDSQQAKQEEEEERGIGSRRSPDSSPVQLELLPLCPVPRESYTEAETSGREPRRDFILSSSQLGVFWSLEHASGDRSNSGAATAERVAAAERALVSQPGASSSPPNSTTGSFHLDFSCLAETATGGRAERATTSRAASDEENSGGTKKKLRLSKEQSAFLEESFKEHSTLNPKQKHALAKQLNLRQRQVEVWFQNRRARTKLKQTEVDCERLKRYCQRLTEENHRLQREIKELRALKAASAAHPFYGGHLPATTLSICVSCERVATAVASKASSPSSPSQGTTANPNRNHLHLQPAHSEVPVGLNSNYQVHDGTPEKS